MQFQPYFSPMNFLWALLFLSLATHAQHVYITSADTFSIGGKKCTNVWVKIEDYSKPVQILLSNQTVLNRVFKAETTNPYFVIENDNIRYRPNLNLQPADTIQQTIATPISSEETNAEWSELLTKIKDNPYEWERTELVKSALKASKKTCNQVIELLNCLSYDSSKIDVINSSAAAIEKECLADIKKHISENYHHLIK